MNQMVQGFLDNDSFFGRFMTKLGIIIAANIMFMLLSIPFFTIGAGLSALYYVMFRTLRSDGGVNPFKEFWAGLKMNFKQATISWILFVLLIGRGRHPVFIPDPCHGCLSGFPAASDPERGLFHREKALESPGDPVF